MEIIRGIHNLKPRHRGCVVTMGNFDGVHLGHQLILQQVKARSEEMGAPSLLICFEPQPKEFFDAYNAPARLTRFREKVGLLAEYGVDL
ncbi:MAG: riboflavin kinase/FMN adenylyltransferase, partial [Saprospiraceae bacterium]